MSVLNEENPALALAIYAATAASVAVNALQRAKLIEQFEVDGLVEALTMCRQRAGDDPRVIELAEIVIDLLLDPSRTGR